MEKTPSLAPPTNNKFIKFFRILGPGIMLASASVGGSHLVASTQAGAKFGWQLLILIILANVFKYPFFLAGTQYAVGTGKSLVEGYSEMGRGYLWLFFILAVFSGVVNTAALLLFSASLLGYLLPFKVSMFTLSCVIYAICLFILLAGHFKVLSKLSKAIMVVLTIATVAAFIIAVKNGAAAPDDFVGPSAFTLASIGFVVITMGWMPAPIELSAINSLWVKRRAQEERVSVKAAIMDFNVGYVVTIFLAIIFMGLGAYVLYGSGHEVASSGIAFTNQLVSIYTTTIGSWSHVLIVLIAFFCIFGSTITVIDGYSRAIVESHLLLKKLDLEQNDSYIKVWMVIIGISSLVIIYAFTSKLMVMLGFAMIMAFVTTPVFAYLNYRLMVKTKLPNELTPSGFFKFFYVSGLIYLFGFLAIFIWWKFFMA